MFPSGGAMPASTVGRPAIMSALQQTSICGLEEPGFPIPPTPAKDPEQWRESLRKVPPEAGGVILLRIGRSYGLHSSWTVVTKIRNREQNDR